MFLCQLNLLKRLLSLTAPKFSSSSAAKSAGEKPILIDREIRIMAMISLLAVLVDIIPYVSLLAPCSSNLTEQSVLLVDTVFVLLQTRRRRSRSVRWWLGNENGKMDLSESTSDSWKCVRLK